MLNKQDFVKEIQNIVQERMGTDCKVIIRRREKNNGVRMTGIEIRKKEARGCPVMYIDKYYDEYIGSETNINDVADDIIEEYEKNQNLISINIDECHLESWDWVKDRVFIKLVNTEMNENRLKKLVNTPFLNLSCIYYIYLGQEKDCHTYVEIQHMHLEQWANITIEELHKVALENCIAKKRCRIVRMEDVIVSMLLDEKMPMEEVDLLNETAEEDSTRMYVLLDESRCNGAADMVYGNHIRELAEQIKSDIYIIPSSVHELILIPKKDGKEDRGKGLQETVKEVNQELLERSEVLSDSVYLYKRETDEIVILA